MQLFQILYKLLMVLPTMLLFLMNILNSDDVDATTNVAGDCEDKQLQMVMEWASNHALLNLIVLIQLCCTNFIIII